MMMTSNYILSAFQVAEIIGSITLITGLKFSYGIAYITMPGLCLGWGAARSEPSAQEYNDAI